MHHLPKFALMLCMLAFERQFYSTICYNITAVLKYYIMNRGEKLSITLTLETQKCMLCCEVDPLEEGGHPTE